MDRGDANGQAIIHRPEEMRFSRGWRLCEIRISDSANCRRDRPAGGGDHEIVVVAEGLFVKGEEEEVDGGYGGGEAGGGAGEAAQG